MVCAHSTGDAHKIDAPIPATNIIAPHERLLKIGRSLNKILFDPIGRIHNINKKITTAKAPSSYIFSSLILADWYKYPSVSVDWSTSIRTYKEIRNESKIGIIISEGFQSLFFRKFLLIIWIKIIL